MIIKDSRVSDMIINDYLIKIIIFTDNIIIILKT